MIVVMRKNASSKQHEQVVRLITQEGLRAEVSRNGERLIISCAGGAPQETALLDLERLAGVEKVVRLDKPYELAARESQEHDSLVAVGRHLSIGGENVVVMAGPCAVENEEQIVETAKAVKMAGANVLRGGAFKPRSSTYSFQGLGEEGLRLLALAREETGLPVVTEVLGLDVLDSVVKYADILQIGSRNMQHPSLLKAVGKAGKPVLLKRGMMATIDELLQAAEYILAAGNPDVILCERGIRTFEPATRNTLDLSAIPVLAERTHLPVIVDPSHGTGCARYVAAMSRAAVAGGADGLLIEVHPRPHQALSDGVQSLDLPAFQQLMSSLRKVALALGRNLGGGVLEQGPKLKSVIG